MTGGDLLHEAIAELYSSGLDEFVGRRATLVAQARAAGEAPAAKKIAALRKPTRSAWVLNQLVRAAPGGTSELDTLGQELRAAHRSLDGPAIRELSSRRRQLIDALARRAFAVSGLASPPAALRVEVTATLGAALADPKIAEQLAAGILARAASADGFGPMGGPELTLVPSPSGGGDDTPAAHSPDAPAGHVPDAPARPAATVTALAAARAKAERERQRQAIAEAEETVAEADGAVANADGAVADADRAADERAGAERERGSAVRVLEERLADARRDLDEARASLDTAREDLDAARLRADRARTTQRQARQALDRLRAEPGGASPHPAKPT